MPKPSKAQSMQLRAAVREAHGARCYLCGSGPLVQRAMHLVDVPKLSPVPLPMCRGCAADWDGSVDYVRKLVRTHLRRYERSVAILRVLNPEADIPTSKHL